MTQGKNSVSLAILATVAVFAAAYFGRDVLLPFVLAVFLTAIIGPVLKRLQRRLPLGVSLGIVLLGLAVVTVGCIALFVATAWQIAAQMPTYSSRFESYAAQILELGARYGIDLDPARLGTEQALEFGLQFVGAGLGSFAALIGELVVVLFITIFLALEAALFERKLSHAFEGGTGTSIRRSVLAIVEQIQKYAATKTLINAISGVGTLLICWALGVDFAFFWALLAFLLSYIPNVGSIIAVIPPAAIAFLEHGSLAWTGLTAGLLALLHGVVGNVLEPRMLGRSMELSTLVVFLSMLLWGWLWGLMGVVLSVPLTVALKLVFAEFEQTRPIAVMMGERVPEPRSERKKGSRAKPVAVNQAQPAEGVVVAASAQPKRKKGRTR
ncbi:MAG: AI-2E family transporter [Myxococcota bacterium]|jgi:predicted PurR-regulated permease PerM|nr:AI-2E family transporter [Myxococcota bacterium]